MSVIMLIVAALVWFACIGAAYFLREQRDDARAQLEQMLRDLNDAKQDAVNAQRYAKEAEPKYEAAAAALAAMQAMDGKFTALVANLRQHAYRQKLMLEQFAENLPGSERERVMALINLPMPKLEDMQ